MSEVSADDAERLPTGVGELDRALGGGPVRGAVILLGGDPGIGKSTLVLQMLGTLSEEGHRSLYVTGEESAAQVALRAERVGTGSMEHVHILSTTDLGDTERALLEGRPEVAVVDSIQTVRSAELSSQVGSVAQLREATVRLIEIAKRERIALFLIGHVTKEGVLAGPKVLEHLVDTVLSFEGDRTHAFRIVRAVKNRFGPAHELGVFEMVHEGLREVPDPSAMFLAERLEKAPGSVVVPTAEGSRPLLVEVQALVAPAAFGGARRVASGVDANRLAILLAVLDRKVGLHVLDQDVFVSVAGGARVDERAADLAVALAIVSSVRNEPVRSGVACFGEVGLASEIRAVPRAGPRVAEAAKMGFSDVLVPAGNLEYLDESERKLAQVHAIKTLDEAVEFAFDR